MVSLSKFGTITGSDFLKGLIVAVFTTASASLYAILQTNALPTVAQLKQIGIVAFFAGISYLVKNLLTNSQDQVLTPEPVPKPATIISQPTAVATQTPAVPVQPAAPVVPNV